MEWGFEPWWSSPRDHRLYWVRQRFRKKNSKCSFIPQSFVPMNRLYHSLSPNSGLVPLPGPTSWGSWRRRWVERRNLAEGHRSQWVLRFLSETDVPGFSLLCVCLLLLPVFPWTELLQDYRWALVFQVEELSILLTAEFSLGPPANPRHPALSLHSLFSWELFGWFPPVTRT